MHGTVAFAEPNTPKSNKQMNTNICVFVKYVKLVGFGALAFAFEVLILGLKMGAAIVALPYGCLLRS